MIERTKKSLKEVNSGTGTLEQNHQTTRCYFSYVQLFTTLYDTD